MSNGIGGTFSYYAHGKETKHVKLNDFNAKFSFNRSEEQYSNNVTVLNGITTVQKGSSHTEVRVKNDAELPTLESIFNADKDPSTFSRKDYNALLEKIGTTVKLNKNWAYRVEKDSNGDIRIDIREILADGTTRTIRENITISTSEELQEKTDSSLTVIWQENGQIKHKTIKFLGDFGFSVNGKTYKTKDGQVYDQDNNPIQALDLPKREAYQLIGMSNTAEQAKDYTFTRKDIDAAIKNNNIQRILGTGVGKLFSASSKDGKYTTECGYTTREGLIFKETVKHSSTVSVWLIEK